jgi:hypothetical protein
VGAQLKGSVLRGYVRWLRSAQLFDAVCAVVPPAARAVMASPPLPTEWLEARVTTLEIVGALADVRDLATVRRMTRETASGSVFPLLRPLIEGILRRTAGPEGVLRQAPFLLTRTARGISFEIEARPGGASVRMRTEGLEETRPSAEAWAGAMEALLALSGVEPEVEVRSVSPSPVESEVRYEVGWRSRV